MTRRTLLSLFAAVLCASFAAPSFARGTPAQAKAIVLKAIEYYQKNGKEKAVTYFKSGALDKGDLYLIVYDFEGNVIRHPKLTGLNLLETADPDGVMLVKDFIKTAKDKGEGWTHYKWSNSETKKIEPKTTYVMRVPGEELLIACGAYD
jgi:cytochrome c